MKTISCPAFVTDSLGTYLVQCSGVQSEEEKQKGKECGAFLSHTEQS